MTILLAEYKTIQDEVRPVEYVMRSGVVFFMLLLLAVLNGFYLVRNEPQLVKNAGRLGLFALNNGRLANGTRVLPDSWMAESTSPSEGADFYGYLWWLIGDGNYQAIGIFGQGIYVNPSENVVIAIHSAREAAGGGFSLQAALYAGIVNALRK